MLHLKEWAFKELAFKELKSVHFWHSIYKVHITIKK